MARNGRPRALRRLLGALCAVAVLAGLPACDQAQGMADGSPSEGGSTPAALPPASGVSTYVALGDSFTAAPYVPVTDVLDGCFRSNGNYPALLAAELDAQVSDVSCGGATTADIRGRQTVVFGGGSVPPQIRAVRPDTDLVTVGIGGNDQNLFANLVTTCTRLAGLPGRPCVHRLADLYGGDTRAVVADTGRRVADVLRLVQRRAPDARVVLVGYPRLVDPAKGCPRFPLARGDRPALAALETRLDLALAGAARDAGADYVDMRALSRGHAICDAEPWVNGNRTDESRALAYHPFAVEQQAVADAVARLLDVA